MYLPCNCNLHSPWVELCVCVLSYEEGVESLTMMHSTLGAAFRRALSTHGTSLAEQPSAAKRVLALFTPEVGIVLATSAALVTVGAVITRLELRHDAKIAALEAEVKSAKEHVDSEVKSAKEHVDSEVKSAKELTLKLLEAAKEHTHTELAGVQQIVDKNAENHVLKLMEGYQKKK